MVDCPGCDGNTIQVSYEELSNVPSYAEKRKAICNSCNQKITRMGFDFCKICKCFIKGKTVVKGAVCPIGKWGKEE